MPKHAYSVPDNFWNFCKRKFSANRKPFWWSSQVFDWLKTYAWKMTRIYRKGISQWRFSDRNGTRIRVVPGRKGQGCQIGYCSRNGKGWEWKLETRPEMNKILVWKIRNRKLKFFNFLHWGTGTRPECESSWDARDEITNSSRDRDPFYCPVQSTLKLFII